MATGVFSSLYSVPNGLLKILNITTDYLHLREKEVVNFKEFLIDLMEVTWLVSGGSRIHVCL